MSAADSTSTVPVDAPAVEKKFIPLSEIAKHNTVESPWVAINGKVYDVARFLDQHPGGEEVILEVAGTDATTAFDDVGHSDTAVEMLEELYVGEGNPEELKVSTRPESAGAELTEEGSNFNLILIIAVLVAVAAYLYFKALKD